MPIYLEVMEYILDREINGGADRPITDVPSVMIPTETISGETTLDLNLYQHPDRIITGVNVSQPFAKGAGPKGLQLAPRHREPPQDNPA